MYHNEMIKRIIEYSKKNDLISNTLYYFIIEKDLKALYVIMDKYYAMEEFSTSLSLSEMKTHIIKVLKHEGYPFNDVVNLTKLDHSKKIIIPFSFQNKNNIEDSYTECFFAFGIE